MSYYLKTGLFVLGLATSATAVNATPVLPGSEQSLQSIVHELHTGGGAPDVNANQLAGDQLWSFEASGTANITFDVEFAGNASSNVFGIYDAHTASLVPLFHGSASTADRATVSLYGDGSLQVAYIDHGGSGDFVQSYVANTFGGNLFGFYLGTPGGVFYSEQSRNAGGADQMVAFRGDGDMIVLPGAFPGVWGPSSYILAWEDMLYGSGDKDFNDLVVYIESVTPVVRVPEPATLALLGLGLIGVGFANRRRRV